MRNSGRAAQAIEESVLRQVRDAEVGIADVTAWDQMDRTGQLAALQSVVARIGYEMPQKRRRAFS